MRYDLLRALHGEWSGGGAEGGESAWGSGLGGRGGTRFSASFDLNRRLGVVFATRPED